MLAEKDSPKRAYTSLQQKYSTSHDSRQSHKNASFKSDPTLCFRNFPNQSWSGRPQSDVESKNLIPASIREPITFTYDGRGYRNIVELDHADIVLKVGMRRTIKP